MVCWDGEKVGDRRMRQMRARRRAGEGGFMVAATFELDATGMSNVLRTYKNSPYRVRKYGGIAAVWI